MKAPEYLINKAINALSVKCVEHLVERNHCSVYEATNQFTNTLTYQSLLDKTSDFYAYSPIDLIRKLDEELAGNVSDWIFA